MKHFFKLLPIICLIFYFSCELSPTDRLLVGTWAIDVLHYKNQDVYDEMIIMNMMTFRDKGTVGIAKLESKLKTKSDLEGTWSFNQETELLSLDTHSDYLNGDFELCFKKDHENGYIRLVLKSEDLYLEAGKVLSESLDIDLPIDCEGIVDDSIE